MHPSKLLSIELHGLEGFLVEIEVDRRAGTPAFIIVGLPDAAVQEAKERVTSAIKNSGYKLPRGRVIVNLAPADLKKIGPRYDLPIALGIITLMGQIKTNNFEKTIILGELALNGRIRPINGILSSVEFAKKNGFKKIILPKKNTKEATLISNIKIIPADNLKEAVMHLNGELETLPIQPPQFQRSLITDVDMGMIKGQALAKRALEIAAAGGHNILLYGAPGAGKTFMARALNSILPPMSVEEMLEVAKIYSIAGLLPKNKPLIENRPFRPIHHTASAISIVGGGNMPGPGEISLAHRGVLFMDEIAEFPKNVLEVLRQPMEDRCVTVSRARGSCTYPCKFMLVAAMNPCPCGYKNVKSATQICTCPAVSIQRYEKRISGPLLDRIDMFISINPVNYTKLTQEKASEGSNIISKRVAQANQIQINRFKNTKIKSNSEMKNKDINKHCQLDSKSADLLKQAMEQMNLSARGYFRILKLARTIADLANQPNITSAHIAEALQYRKQMF